MVLRKAALSQVLSMLWSSILFDTVFLILTLTAASGTLILTLGILMNLFHGMVAAAYLTFLAAFVPQQQHGRAFGFAYALGSLGTYFISLLSNGRLISSDSVLTIYLTFILINALLVLFANNLPSKQDSKDASKISLKAEISILIPALVLMAMISSIGSHYQFQAVADQNVSIELSRSFYAIGLITAGILTDINRKLGAIFCFVSLLFPFLQISLQSEPSLIHFSWGLSYLILGFYSVYRAVVFVDIGGKDVPLLPFAGFGLCLGRIGEALATFIPSEFLNNSLYGTITVFTLFIPFAFLFFHFYNKLYIHSDNTNKSTREKNDKFIFMPFEQTYCLTKRENEVLEYILSGFSNPEISKELYISESTVKFHIKNVLRKTSCSNRAELTHLFNTHSSDI